MVKVDSSVRINRPVQEVFAFVTDPANNSKWQQGLIEQRLESPGPLGVGRSNLRPMRQVEEGPRGLEAGAGRA